MPQDAVLLLMALLPILLLLRLDRTLNLPWTWLPFGVAHGDCSKNAMRTDLARFSKAG